MIPPAAGDVTDNCMGALCSHVEEPKYSHCCQRGVILHSRGTTFYKQEAWNSTVTRYDILQSLGKHLLERTFFRHTIGKDKRIIEIPRHRLQEE